MVIYLAIMATEHINSRVFRTILMGVKGTATISTAD